MHKQRECDDDACAQAHDSTVESEVQQPQPRNHLALVRVRKGPFQWRRAQPNADQRHKPALHPPRLGRLPNRCIGRSGRRHCDRVQQHRGVDVARARRGNARIIRVADGRAAAADTGLVAAAIGAAVRRR